MAFLPSFNPTTQHQDTSMTYSPTLLLTTGFALFSMFFGSGNLVFPVLVGKACNGHLWTAYLGLFLTGVGVPFMGALAMLLYKGNTDNFFGVLGSKLPFFLTLFSLSLMGPFGVQARCITVAHGSLYPLFPKLSLSFFSLIFCLLLQLASCRPSKLLQLLGAVLSPILLLSIVLLGALGWIYAPKVPIQQDIQAFKAFSFALFQGYQTMDLLAAFFFSSFILKYIPSSTPSPFAFTLKASLIGMGLLSFIYGLLLSLGHFYALSLQQILPENMLSHIATKTLGIEGSTLFSLLVMMACFTTAVVLNTLFAEFLCKHLSFLSLPQASFITLIIAFSISNLEFHGIALFIAPILECIYPALIALTLVNIIHKLTSIKAYPHLPYFVFGLSVLNRFL